MGRTGKLCCLVWYRIIYTRKKFYKIKFQTSTIPVHELFLEMDDAKVANTSIVGLEFFFTPGTPKVCHDQLLGADLAIWFVF
jgi:hypothetical protein